MTRTSRTGPGPEDRSYTTRSHAGPMLYKTGAQRRAGSPKRELVRALGSLECPARDGWCYHLCRVNCGKPRCRKCRGGGYPHGPYWYAKRRGPRGGVITLYIGKRLKSVTDKRAERSGGAS